MVREINIYIEGGGCDNNLNRTKLRQGFNAFLKEIVDTAREKRIRWNPIACGSRNDAFDDFCTGIKSNPNAIHVLLVDSEDAIAKGSTLWAHLKRRDKWVCPAGMNDDCCFLMEQSMETWLVADRNALAKFYGQGFNPKPLPAPARDIETVDKDQLMKALEAATAKSKTKGTYHKTRHGFDILALADPKIVRKSASHCERLFTSLLTLMEAPPDEG